MELKINHLNKSYGTLKALSDVTLSLSDGIYGLLGPNGAGKSTLMNILTGNLEADSGEVLFNEKNVLYSQNHQNWLRHLGYMPQNETLYPSFTGLEFMYYMAALKEIGKDSSRLEIRRLLKSLGLWDVRNKTIRSYSGGMKRRLLLAQAMLGDPDILILDEPTAGMDPQQRIAVRNLIGQKALSKIVIISTHVVSDIEYIAHAIILLNHGSILSYDEPFRLRQKMKGKVFETLVRDCDIQQLAGYGQITAISRAENGALVRLVTDTPPKNASEVSNPSLEDVYQYLFRKEAGV